ncbi:ankyrin repeat domain-containing protein [Flavihumibacter solisilvae]|nr:ankyrin repeat domain-containing protein [Flavihumibacter solisilvae]
MDIIQAVEKGKTEQVEKELQKGADVNTADKNGRSLLLIATRNNDLNMAELLVKHGANVNQQDNIKDSPFLFAGASGYLQLVKLFLGNGARFDVFNRYNGSALIPACERGHVETVRLLANTKGFPIDHINRLGWTGLLEAVILGDGSEPYIQIVQILVDAGTNVKIADKDGVTPLQHARSRGFTQIAGILEKAAKK